MFFGKGWPSSKAGGFNKSTPVGGFGISPFGKGFPFI
jgi:hypothetical protein